jgi:hypothetical protein
MARWLLAAGVTTLVLFLSRDGTSAVATAVASTAHAEAPMPGAVVLSLDDLEPSPLVPAGPATIDRDAPRGSTAAQPWDDSWVYAEPLSEPPALLPATAQGVLAAVQAQRERVARCIAPLRATRPHAVTLQTLRVRIAQQDRGGARIEELHAPREQDDLHFTGCLAHALGRAHFEPPSGGFTWVELLVELEAS